MSDSCAAMKVLPAKVNEPDYALAARGALQCKFVPATNAHENATDEQRPNGSFSRQGAKNAKEDSLNFRNSSWRAWRLGEGTLLSSSDHSRNCPRRVR